MSIRVVFWGNSASTFSARHFAALLDTPAELVAVVDVPPTRRDTTNPLPDDLPDPVRTARQRGVATYEPENPNQADFITALTDLRSDLFIAAGYALILRSAALAVPGMLAANFHASLLPEYRGKHPVFWALRNGERWSGLTVHAMDSGIDTGDILYQVKVRTRREDSVANLYERIMARSLPLVEQLVVDAAGGSLPRRAQPSSSGSYYSGTTDEDFRLDWDWPADKIRRFITVTPGKCYTNILGKRVYFHNAETEKTAQADPPGTLLRVGRSRAVIAANRGAISSSHAQVEGEAAESLADLCGRMGLAPGALITA